MKRTPLRRGTKTLRRSPLARATEWMRRFVPLPKRNAPRLAKLREVQFDHDGYLKYVIAQPCVACGGYQVNERTGEIENHPHHTVARNPGGKARDMCSLCHTCHRLGHDAGWGTFQLIYHVDLRAKAAEMYAEYLERSEAAA